MTGFIRRAWAKIRKRVSPKPKQAEQPKKFAGYENLGNAATTSDDIDWNEFELWFDGKLKSNAEVNAELQQIAAEQEAQVNDRRLIVAKGPACDTGIMRAMFPRIYAEPPIVREYNPPAMQASNV